MDERTVLLLRRGFPPIRPLPLLSSPLRPHSSPLLSAPRSSPLSPRPSPLMPAPPRSWSAICRRSCFRPRPPRDGQTLEKFSGPTAPLDLGGFLC
ncbi:hypothetical protein M758_2G193900, partial [Ceratodon purpureus]